MIDRESMVEASVQKVAEDALQHRGYDTQYEIVEAFPGKRTELFTNLIAIGFNFDDGGQEAEIGSDLRKRIYTIEFYVFGKTQTFARNIANVLKFALENGSNGEQTIVLLDVSQTPPVEIDRLVVNAVHAQRVPIVDPEPWQQFSWLTTVTVEDWYYASST